jgi:hypothetical protein
LASSSALIAASNLGPHTGPIDSVTAGYLTFMGDHLFEQERNAAKAKKEKPPFPASVPAYFTRALRVAYGEIYMLDEYALPLSLINRTSPFSYPDPIKAERALLLLPHPDLIERELDRTSSLLATRRGRALGLI